MLLSSFIRFLRRPPVGVFYYSKHHRTTPQPRPATRPATRPRFLTIKRNTKNTTAAQNAENKQPKAPKQYI
jgi:hypothetical protein